MKKYKTWEAFKKLTENPELQFETYNAYNIKRILRCNKSLDNKSYFFYCTSYEEDGTKIETEGQGNFNGNISSNVEWTLINQEIPFLHAIKEYQNGKTIYCILKSKRDEKINKIIYSHQTNKLIDTEVLDTTRHGLSTDEILKGHWYIEEN